MPSWYTSELGSAGNLASEVRLSHPQGATLGCGGSSRDSERESPLPSTEAESSTSADVGGVRLASSDESHGAVPKVGTSARVTGEAVEQKRVRRARLKRRTRLRQGTRTCRA